MDVVYICRHGKNEELRYSIRSVVKNLAHDNIWVVGGKPQWYVGNYILVPRHANKYVHGRRNLRAICESEEISEKFVLMNDDFFIMKKMAEIPALRGGRLTEKIEIYRKFAPKGRFLNNLLESLSVLANLGVRTSWDYAIHVPMVMEKKKLAKILDYPGSVRTNYGNIYKVGGKKIADVKVHAKKQDGPEPFDYLKYDSPFLSTADNTFNRLRAHVLRHKFPNRTSYERF
jgi:hypothetical protein